MTDVITPRHEPSVALPSNGDHGAADLSHSPGNGSATPTDPPTLNGSRPAPTAYRVKFVARRDPRWLPALVYVYLAIAPVYAAWRFTLVNWSVWFGPLTFLAEIFSIVTTLLFLMVTQKILVPERRTAVLNRTVDALIPTYNEPLTVLEPTIRAALAVRGIASVLVLDDGDRPEVKQLAEHLGARYFARTDNRYAKAGNMNNGLAHSDAEFILSLDADHVPLPNFLEETLGYFDDPDVAFVQTPQTYYNTTSFLFRRTAKRLWSEQCMFYDTIQVAKNRWNSAFFVGTSAVLRRAALDDVGGFATGTATEDIHTSLRLHARGWRSILLPRPLAFGLEAENLKEYHRQRRRWAAGSIGLLLRSPDSPLAARGLTLAQRLNYVSACCAHLQGIQKLYYFLLPILCIATLKSPVEGDLLAAMPVIIGFLLVSVAITSAYARGTYHPLHTEAYNLSQFLAHFGGLKGALRIQKKFSVSRKQTNPAERTWLKLAYWALVVLVLVSVGRSISVLQGSAGHDVSTLMFVSLGIMSAYTVILLSFLGCLELYEYKHRRGTLELRRPVLAPSLNGTRLNGDSSSVGALNPATELLRTLSPHPSPIGSRLLREVVLASAAGVVISAVVIAIALKLGGRGDNFLSPTIFAVLAAVVGIGTLALMGSGRVTPRPRFKWARLAMPGMAAFLVCYVPFSVPAVAAQARSALAPALLYGRADRAAAEKLSHDVQAWDAELQLQRSLAEAFSTQPDQRQAFAAEVRSSEVRLGSLSRRMRVHADGAANVSLRNALTDLASLYESRVGAIRVIHRGLLLRDERLVTRGESLDAIGVKASRELFREQVAPLLDEGRLGERLEAALIGDEPPSPLRPRA